MSEGRIMKLNKQYQFFKMLNKFIEKGYSFNESLHFLTTIYPKTTNKIIKGLEKGQTLAILFKKCHFKHFVSDFLIIGEASNKVNDSIAMIVTYFDFIIKIKKHISKTLYYPFILFIIALIAFEFISTFLYPLLNSLYIESIPNPHLVFLAFNSLKYISIIVLAILGLNLLFKKLSNGLPFVKLYRSLYLCHHLMILMRCGYSLEDAMTELNNTLDSKKYSIDALNQLLIHSKKPSMFFSFHPTFIQFLKIGIDSNRLYPLLDDFQSIYIGHLEDGLFKVSYRLQTGIYLIIAVNIFLIYYVIMIPMYSITNLI